MARHVGRHVEIVRRILRRETYASIPDEVEVAPLMADPAKPARVPLWTGTEYASPWAAGDTMIDNLLTLALCAALVPGLAPGLPLSPGA